jgi:hypothetical protein
MEPREHIEHAKRAAEATRHHGPRTHLETIAALEVLGLALVLGVVTLAIQFYDNGARQLSYRVSDSYAEAIIGNQQPAPTPSPGSGWDFGSIAKTFDSSSLIPHGNIDLLSARQARHLRDNLETFVGVLEVLATALQIGVVLASAAVLNRRFSRWLLIFAPAVPGGVFAWVLFFILFG